MPWRLFIFFYMTLIFYRNTLSSLNRVIGTLVLFSLGFFFNLYFQSFETALWTKVKYLYGSQSKRYSFFFLFSPASDTHFIHAPLIITNLSRIESQQVFNYFFFNSLFCILSFFTIPRRCTRGLAQSSRNIRNLVLIFKKMSVKYIMQTMSLYEISSTSKIEIAAMPRPHVTPKRGSRAG